MSRKTSELTELENELTGRSKNGEDDYIRDLKLKIDQRKVISNLLESRD